jgi:hypothetical protein
VYVDIVNPDNSVDIVTSYELDDRGIGLRFPAEAREYFFSQTTSLAVGPTWPPIGWAPGLLSQLEVGYKVIEAYSWSQSGAEFQIAWSYTSTVSQAFTEHNCLPVKLKKNQTGFNHEDWLRELCHIKCTDGSEVLDSIIRVGDTSETSVFFYRNTLRHNDHLSF